MKTRFTQFSDEELAILSEALHLQFNNAFIYLELLDEITARKNKQPITSLVTEDCITLIKMFEGLYLNAYLCPANVPTIGYGTTVYPNGNKVKLGDVIDESEANTYLWYEVNEKAIAVQKLLGDLIIPQNQFDALVSFAYNVGIGALRDSTLLKLLKMGKVSEASEQLLRWNKGGGKVLPGLTKRRIAEKALFDKVI